MFLLTPRYIKQAKHLRRAAKKLLNYRRDVWSEDQVDVFTSAIEELSGAIRLGTRQSVQDASESLERLAGKFAPPPPNPGLRENCEVLLVAIVIAVGIRAYFLQPFKIPTGSMQPTLHGIVGTPSDLPMPNPLQRIWDLAIKGRTWIELKAERDEEIVELYEWSVANFFVFTDIRTADEKGETATYTVFAPKDTLVRSFGVTPGKTYQAGAVIAKGCVDTGDQVFVDKASYHFVRPELGEVFVFKTTGIHGIQRFIPPGMGSQYYIKRLAGLPGDRLQIKPPDLYVNGRIPDNAMMRKVMSREDGYEGYSNGPAGRGSFPILGSPSKGFTVPAKSYFALGDNSYHSSDSRNWGIVPEENVAGRGLFVYWPFTSRWGLVR